jgi:zinc/manganese transport system substrate-binding protein
LTLAAIGAIAFAAQSTHAAKIRVVTTLTDLGRLHAQCRRRSFVEVRSLATGIEDTHGVPMKPSFVPVLNRADLVVLVGFDCEHAFLPALLEASKNPRIQKGKPGYVDCSQGITPVDVPKSTDHSEGDVHPYGNPHYMLDPVLAKTAVQNICNALVAVAPQYAADFTNNRDAYLAKLDAKIAGWQSEARAAQGNEVRVLSRTLAVFRRRDSGMDYFGTIELKPGIDPTPRHIEELIFDEGGACFHRRARTAVPGKGSRPDCATNRRNAGETAHHARRRAAHGHLHRNDGLHRPHHGWRAANSDENKRSLRAAGLQPPSPIRRGED